MQVSTLNVTLSGPPPSDVEFITVTIDTSDAGALVSITACTLVFKQSNWNIPQSVYVLAKNTGRDTGKRVRPGPPGYSFHNLRSIPLYDIVLCIPL